MAATRKKSKRYASQFSAKVKTMIAESMIEMLSELFKDESFSYFENSDASQSGLKAGLIDFQGDLIFGSLAVSASDHFLETSYKIYTKKSEKPSTEEIEDWVGEMTNWVTGNLKHKLNNSGVYVTFTSPHLANMDDIHLAFTRDIAPMSYQFKSAAGREIFLNLMAQKGAKFDLTENQDAELDTEKGSLLLFD